MQELLNKYNLDETYASYLEKFSDDLQLMDINAYVLSRIDKTIEIHFLDGNRNIGSYGISSGFDLNNSTFLDSRRSGIKNILIDELLNTINLITKELESLETIYMISHKEIPIGYDAELIVEKNANGLTHLKSY